MDKRHPERGVTIIETSIVITILALLLSIVIPISLDFYLTYQLDSEVQILNSVLRQARNLAMVNHNESRHGVYVGSNEFVLFQGINYASRDQSQDQDFPRTTALAVTGPTEIVFEALSGRVASSTFTLSNAQRTKFIYVNEEGRIQY